MNRAAKRLHEEGGGKSNESKEQNDSRIRIMHSNPVG